MKVYRRSRGMLYSFLTSALYGSGQLKASAAITPEKNSGTIPMGSCVDPGAILDL
jgi:hypothetical protein